MTKTADKTGSSALRANPTGETSTPPSRRSEPQPWPGRLLTALIARGDPVLTALIAKQRFTDWDETHVCPVNPR